MLKVFNISSNGFSNDGVVAMAKALEVNSSLLELDISYVRLCVCLLICSSRIQILFMHPYSTLIIMFFIPVTIVASLTVSMD